MFSTVILFSIKIFLSWLSVDKTFYKNFFLSSLIFIWALINVGESEPNNSENVSRLKELFVVHYYSS